MTIEDVNIDLRLTNKADGKARALADVELKFSPSGAMRLFGFRVMESDDHNLWVASPSRKGTTKFFRVVELSGDIKRMVETAVLKEFERVAQSPGQE